ADTTPTSTISLCKMDCWLRLSHFNVTPDQFFSVTVPWSFLSSRQQTRAPTLNDLDWEPVFPFAPVSRVYPGCISLAAWRGDCQYPWRRRRADVRYADHHRPRS